MPKTDKKIKVRKKWKKWIYDFSETCSCSKTKQDSEFPFDTFLPNDP